MKKRPSIIEKNKEPIFITRSITYQLRKMSKSRESEDNLSNLRDQLKALSNRHAIEILQVLNPQTGEIIPTLGWDNIVEGLLALDGIIKPDISLRGERTQDEAQYENMRQGLMSGGTIYETMNKLVKAGFVISSGERGKRQRGFMITHEGRLALASIGQLEGPIGVNTEVQLAARTLLKYKNFVSLLPAQDKFVRDIGDINQNLVIQMPPGSGKTFLAMIVILLKLQKGVKCLYLSPYTSLSRQIIDEYGPLLEDMGYSVVRFDGLTPASDAELESANLAIVMYETFASELLKKKKWTERIGLSVIDELTELDSVQTHVEAQNLGTDRSVKLDFIVTLLKEQSQILTLSSRFGNTERIAEWLGASVFKPNVQLQPDEFIVVRSEQGIEIKSSDGTQWGISQREDFLDAVMDHIQDYEKKSILFVVGSRYKAQGIARRLANSHPRKIQKEVVERILGTGERLPLSTRLSKTLSSGVAFHHSGLDAGVRQRLEQAIKDRVVRTVVSTTGITSGMSFPFDSVVILFDPNMYFLTVRSRYLQIAGRIGEYHLAQYGGRVYLIFEGPFQDMPSSEAMVERLLHKPLEPLCPGPLYPSLAVSILVRDIIGGNLTTKEDSKKRFLEFVKNTYRAKTDQEYTEKMNKFFETMFAWLAKEKILEADTKGYKIDKEARKAILAGMDPIDYIQVKNTISNLKEIDSESMFIDLLLCFHLPLSIRPRTFVPSKNELKIMELNPPEEWYMSRVPEREEIKRRVLERWLDEQEVSIIISETRELAKGISLDEGDLDSLLGVCSAAADNLSRFYREIRIQKLSDRCHILSRQLQYGVHPDLADSDLLDLQFIKGDNTPSNRISRVTARHLYENEYHSISDIVRKDIDASKKGLARDRFAKNCGLELDMAREVYKAAMMHIRSKLKVDDEDEDA